MAATSSQLLKRLANTLIALLVILSIAWVLFGLAYWRVEDYRLIESLHWSMQTLTTTGYGDKAPQTDAGMVLSMLLQPMAVVTTLLLGANFVKSAIEDPNAFTHEEQLALMTDAAAACQAAQKAVRKATIIDAKVNALLHRMR